VQGHVQPGDGRGVAEERLLGILSLSAPGELPTPVERVGQARGPPVARSGAGIGVGLPSPAHPEPPQAIQAVAGRSLGEREQGLDLLGGGHAVFGEDRHDVPVG
jgi:hypothetical protein